MAEDVRVVERPMNGWHRWQRGSLACIAFAVLVLLSSGCSGESEPEASQGSAEDPEGPVPFRVTNDPELRPDTTELEGFDEGDPSRPVGRIENPEGSMDVVLDEAIVLSSDSDEVEAFVARWDGEIVDKMPSIPEDPEDVYLVRIDPAGVDTATVAADLARIEEYSGEMRIGGERLLQLMAVLASENTDTLAMSFNTLDQADGIAEGEVNESPGIGNSNVFDWSFMRGGGNQDFAVAPAWQLLEAHGRLTPSVTIMINDGGFVGHRDLPSNTTLRHASWDAPNRGSCSSGPCPYHGETVSMTAAARVDNDYGTAGTGGPVVDHLVNVAHYPSRYKRLRRLEDMVEQYRPDVVNMSYSGRITVFRGTQARTLDRRYKRILNGGSLLVSSAGNQGSSVDQRRSIRYPCESTHVLCVGGLDFDSTEKAPSSNYGPAGDTRSVELYGPYFVQGKTDPLQASNDSTDNRMRRMGGTSYSAPFVAGVAALVMAADPDMRAPDVRQLLKDTANEQVECDCTIGSPRSVDALAAVAAALNADVEPPTVRIETPKADSTYSIASSDLVLQSTTGSFFGNELSTRWESDENGLLGESADTLYLPLKELGFTPGSHEITATVEDTTGLTATETIEIDVVERLPHTVSVTAPSEGATFEAGDTLFLSAGTTMPDTFTPIPDNGVEWSIARNGTVPVRRTGHHAQIDLAQAGTYTVRVDATHEGHTASAERTVVVEAVPAGEARPEVRILSPNNGAHFGVSPGAKKSISVRGSATDAEGPSISGTRMRWYAVSGGIEVELCRGSSFAMTELGLSSDASALTDCAATDVELGGSPSGASDSSWILYLEASDTDGNIGIQSIRIEVQALAS